MGIGCGGLTAATLYLIWSLFAPNGFHFRGHEDDDESDDDDVGPKKMGYVGIPAADVAPAKLWILLLRRKWFERGERDLWYGFLGIYIYR